MYWRSGRALDKTEGSVLLVVCKVGALFIDKATTSMQIKTSWEKWQTFDKVTRVTHRYSRLLHMLYIKSYYRHSEVLPVDFGVW